MNSSFKFQAHQNIINHFASYNNVNYLNSMHNAISMDAPTRWTPFSFVWAATFLIISETNWFLLLYHRIVYISYTYRILVYHIRFLPQFGFFALPFALHIRRAIYFSHRLVACLYEYEYLCVCVCLCVCVWMNVNLNELPPCLTFPFAKRERDTKAFWAPNRGLAILFTMPNTSQFLILINLFAEIARGTWPNFVRALRLPRFCFHFSYIYNI